MRLGQAGRVFLLAVGTFAQSGGSDAVPASAPRSREGAGQAAAVLIRCQRALGGSERLRAIRDITRIVDLSKALDQVRATQVLQILLPSVIRQTSRLGSSEITAFFDGARGWAKSPWGVDDPLPDWQVRAARQDLFRQLETLVLANENPAVTLEMLMADKAAGRDTAALRIFLDEDRDIRLWVDAKSGLPKKLQYPRVRQRGLGEIVEDVFDDYRDVDGLRMPFRITTSADGRPYMETLVVKVAYNTGLRLQDLAEFETPSR